VWSSKPVAGSELSTLWLVPRNDPRCTGLPGGFDGLGLRRGNDSSPIAAEDARIPATARLGEDGGGFAIMMGTVLPWFNVLAGGRIQRLMEARSSGPAATRPGPSFQHAGTTIADLPTIRAYIARCGSRPIRTRRLLADTLAALAANRGDAMLRVLESKAAAGEAAAEVTDLAMRVCGGAAFRKEVGVERSFATRAPRRSWGRPPMSSTTSSARPCAAMPLF